MAGGHALTRVDSGAMKFRPGGASRRPNPPSTPARPSASTSMTPNPSRSASALNQASGSRDGLASSSDTEAGPSRGGIPIIASSRGPHISITPGVSRIASQQRAPSDFPTPRATNPTAPRPTLVAPTGLSDQGAVITRPTTAANDSLDTPTQAPSTSNPPNTVATVGSTSTMSKANKLLPTHNSAPLLTPPPTQNFNTLNPPASRPGIAIQPGLSQTSAIRLPQTPPPTQPLASNFPVDPDLLEFTNEPFGGQLEVGDLFNVPLTQPEPTVLPNLVGVGPLPPPPLLEPAPQAQIADPNPPAPAKKGRKKPINADKPRKRRRTAQAQSDAEDQGEEAEQSGRCTRKKRSGGIKVRRAKTVEEKIEAFEQRAARAAEEGENEEPLDPTTATMASLCESDLPNGRISSKYIEKGIAYVKHVEERRQRILERTAERIKKLRTSGLDPDQTQPPPPVKQPEPTPAPPSAEVDEDENPVAGPSRRELGASLSPSPERELEPAPPEEKFAETAAAPQIRFVNGEMVLDEESQFYDRAGPTQQDEDAMVVVDEADSTRFSNSSSFMRKAGSRGSRWTADETEMFYWCLSAFGEDYENIARYLGRTPLQCKNKTKSEDRRGNEKRITMAIKTRIPLDLEEFGRITGRDFSGPPPTIRTPAVPPPSGAQEQEPVVAAGKAKALSSTPAPASAQKKRGKPVSHADEEVITLEEYLRNENDD